MRDKPATSSSGTVMFPNINEWNASFPPWDPMGVPDRTSPVRSRSHQATGVELVADVLPLSRCRLKSSRVVNGMVFCCVRRVMRPDAVQAATCAAAMVLMRPPGVKAANRTRQCAAPAPGAVRFCARSIRGVMPIRAAAASGRKACRKVARKFKVSSMLFLQYRQIPIGNLENN